MLQSVLPEDTVIAKQLFLFLKKYYRCHRQFYRLGDTPMVVTSYRITGCPIPLLLEYEASGSSDTTENAFLMDDSLARAAPLNSKRIRHTGETRKRCEGAPCTLSYS